MAAGAQLRPALPSLARREPACMKPLDARSEPRSQPVSKDSLRKTVECKYSAWQGEKWGVCRVLGMRDLCRKPERVLVSQVCTADRPLTPTFFIKPVYFKPEAMCYLSRKSMLSLFF